MPPFFFHYNKPATAKRGTPMMTVHYQGACHLVESIDCAVPVKTRTRKQQPRIVVAGTGTVTFDGTGAVIR